MSQHTMTSGVVRDIFENYVKKMPGPIKTKIKNMSSTQKRYESKAKPGGRGVWYVDPMIDTCEELIASRVSDIVSDAKSYLRFLDEESYVQSAMMSDAAHQVLDLTR